MNGGRILSVTGDVRRKTLIKREERNLQVADEALFGCQHVQSDGHVSLRLKVDSRATSGGGFLSTRHEVDLVGVFRVCCSMYLFLLNCHEIPQKLEVYASVF
jgi:hypothetical protein